MTRPLSFIILSTLFLSACDSPPAQSKITPRSEPECSLCFEDQTGKDKVRLLEYDCSLGTMLACLDQGLLTEDECKQLVVMQGGQLETYQKWQVVVGEATEWCADVCP